jgi:uncharacterized membrane protein
MLNNKFRYKIRTFVRKKYYFFIVILFLISIASTHAIPTPTGIAGTVIGDESNNAQIIVMTYVSNTTSLIESKITTTQDSRFALVITTDGIPTIDHYIKAQAQNSYQELWIRNVTAGITQLVTLELEPNPSSSSSSSTSSSSGTGGSGGGSTGYFPPAPKPSLPVHQNYVPDPENENLPPLIETTKIKDNSNNNNYNILRNKKVNPVVGRAISTNNVKGIFVTILWNLLYVTVPLTILGLIFAIIRYKKEKKLTQNKQWITNPTHPKHP